MDAREPLLTVAANFRYLLGHIHGHGTEPWPNLYHAKLNAVCSTSVHSQRYPLADEDRYTFLFVRDVSFTVNSNENDHVTTKHGLCLYGQLTLTLLSCSLRRGSVSSFDQRTRSNWILEKLIPFSNTVGHTFLSISKINGEEHLAILFDENNVVRFETSKISFKFFSIGRDRDKVSLTFFLRKI